MAAGDHPHDHTADGHAGHQHDQGVRGAVRYLRLLPRLWRSEVNDAVVRRIDPRPGEAVVDIGAGMGAAAVAASVTGARVVAVEPTPLMRGLLRLRLTLGRHRGLELAEGTAEHLPLPEGSVDAIWAVNTLHHWSDLERGVSEIARVLAPQGRVLLVDEDFADPRHPEHRRFGGGGDRHGFLQINADRLGELLGAAGLTCVDTSLRELAGRPVVGASARGKDAAPDGSPAEG